MSTRTKYMVSPVGDRWKVVANGQTVARRPTQQSAITQAKRLARADKPAEVVVQGEDGEIRDKWSYGEDPSEIPG